MSTENKSDQKDYYHQADPQYKLRWSKELREKVAASAKAYNRSMNADIVARLEKSFEAESDLSPLNMPPEELQKKLELAKTKFQSQKEPIQELNLIISPNDGDEEKIVISKKFYNELMGVKSALRNLSLAVLDLEKHSLDLENGIDDDSEVE